MQRLENIEAHINGETTVTHAVRPEDALQTDLRRLAERHPNMAELISLYQDIAALQTRAAAAMPAARVRPPRWGVGAPRLQFDDLGLTPELMAPWISELRALLIAAGVGSDEVDPWGHASAAEWLDLARAGFEARAGPTAPPFAGGPSSLAVGQALVGALAGSAPALRAEVDAAQWYRGYCPICGGWADLSLIAPDTEARTLVCSRCDAVWPFRRVGCAFCGEDDRMQRSSSPDQRFSVVWCDHCRAYLKQARWPAPDLPATPLGLRLLMVGMDLEAQAQGLASQPAPEVA
jgi:hypothetical protein